MSVSGLMLMLMTFGAACSDEGSPTESVVMEGVEVVKPDPTVSSMMEGVEVDRSLPPTAEGDAEVDDPRSSGGPRRGGVLASPVTHCPIPDPAIDHAAFFTLGSPPLVTEIHAGLMRVVDDPVAPFEFELADSYNVSIDGLEYEFVLRNDLKFSDGTPLVASDFKWSWERALKKSQGGSRAQDVFGLVEGADTVISGDSEDLTGVVAVDDRTLQVSLTAPRADFPALLADPVAYVLKKDNVLSWGINYTNSGTSTMSMPFNEFNMPVGAGPFKLIDHWEQSQNGRCVIDRNPHYWGEPAYLDAVWYRTDATETERTDDGWLATSVDPQAFVEQAIDFEELPTTFSVDESGEDSEGELEVQAGEGIAVDDAEDAVADFPATFIFAVLNAAAPPFDDIHFRRAATAYSQLTGYLQFVDADARLITEELTTLEPRAEFIRYDEEFAEAELAASEYAGDPDARKITVLPPMNFIVTDIEDPSFVEWAQALNLTLQEDDFGVGTLDEFEGRRNNRYQIRIYRVTPAYPDPITILRALTAPFGKINRAPDFVELDAMVVAAAIERDAVKRHELYLEIEEYVAEKALVIPIAVMPATSFYRYHPWVHDLNPSKYPSSIFHKVWLDETAPKRELPLP